MRIRRTYAEGSSLIALSSFETIPVRLMTGCKNTILIRNTDEKLDLYDLVEALRHHRALMGMMEEDSFDAFAIAAEYKDHLKSHRLKRRRRRRLMILKRVRLRF